MQSAIYALRERELIHQENLMKVLSVINGSKSKEGSNGNLLSIARGLCTYNQKILTSIANCVEDAEQNGVEAYKSFVSEFIMWFSGSSIIFEKYLHSLPFDGLATQSVHQKPLEHFSEYSSFIDVALGTLRNPFVVEKLTEAKSQIDALNVAHKSLVRELYLNNITFDQVQGFGGLTVSCYFTIDQVVERTEDESIFMGDTKVELMLLNLDKDSTMYTMRDFNALVVLKIPSQPGSRAVVYPPFRINDLSMSLSYNCINFSSVAYASESEGATFAITGSESIIQDWYEKLKLLFPAANEVLTSESIQLEGLGINTILQSFKNERKHSFNNYLPISPPLLVHRQLRQSDGDDMDETGYVGDTITCIESYSKQDNSPESCQSLHKVVSSDALSINSDGFELVTKVPAKVFGNKHAAASLPELKPKAVHLFQNAAGSAIDISNFGKSHNPTFTPQLKADDKGQRSFFGMFKKKGKVAQTNNLRDASGKKPLDNAHNEKKDALENQKSTEEREEKFDKKQAKEKQKNSKQTKSTSGKTSVESSLSKKSSKDTNKKTDHRIEKTPQLKQPESKTRSRPDLTISIPKALEAPNAAFASLKSTLFSPSSTVPLPFALPSSTSTYFFKHYIDNPNLSGSNLSLTDLSQLERLPALQIPQNLKDEINSEDSIDFYISPSTSKTLRVSKWKPRAGKWEMITASNEVFVKIVVNYILDKRYLLVFKEEMVDGEVADIPLLILDLNNQSKFRRSSASDIEIGAINAITNEKMLIIIRCYKGEVFDALYSSLENNFEAMKSPVMLQKSSNYESNVTLTSSLMSRPSTTSTLASLYTSLDQKSASDADFTENQQYSGGEKILLERMTVKLHKQMESMDSINILSSWKAISMFSLCLLHSIDEFGSSFFHFELVNKNGDDECDEFDWTIAAKKMSEKTHRIGKAGLLVMPETDDIFMLECKGSKELRRLLSTYQ